MSNVKKNTLALIEMALKEAEVRQTENIYVELTGGRDSFFTAWALAYLGYKVTLNVVKYSSYPWQLLEKSVAHVNAKYLAKTFDTVRYTIKDEDFMEMKSFDNNVFSSLYQGKGANYGQAISNIFSAYYHARPDDVIAFGIKNEISGSTYDALIHKVSDIVKLITVEGPSRKIIRPLKYVNSTVMIMTMDALKLPVKFWSCVKPMTGNRTTGSVKMESDDWSYRPCRQCSKCLEYMRDNTEYLDKHHHASVVNPIYLKPKKEKKS